MNTMGQIRVFVRVPNSYKLFACSLRPSLPTKITKLAENYSAAF